MSLSWDIKVGMVKPEILARYKYHDGQDIRREGIHEIEDVTGLIGSTPVERGVQSRDKAESALRT